MPPLAIEYYVGGAGLISAVAAALAIKRRVLSGRFGRFAIFEHIILPSIIFTACLIAYFSMDIEGDIASGFVILSCLLLFAILATLMPLFLIVYVYFFYFIAVSWIQIVEIAAAICAGATIGNILGFVLGSIKLYRTVRN
ncbi:hypothetical protein [Rhizobium rhizogenes]|jgi:hypothetical protein|uniref:hypothetical protein n=1 Tax=Rhizobium rhizogenes TaxID=359 RepID=UPI003F5002C5